MRRGILLSLVLVIASGLALFVDLPVARFLAAHHLPGDLYRLVMLAETFGFGLSVGLILVIAWILDKNCRVRWHWAALATLMAGIMSNLAKLILARVRPRAIGDVLQHDFDSLPSVRETFQQWLPPLAFDSALQSFPSGHAAAAAGLAVSLTWLYPQGRWVFCFLAVMACFQRMASQAHYLSDVLAGAALGTFAATLLLKMVELRRMQTELPPLLQDQTTESLES